MDSSVLWMQQVCWISAFELVPQNRVFKAVVGWLEGMQLEVTGCTVLGSSLHPAGLLSALKHDMLSFRFVRRKKMPFHWNRLFLQKNVMTFSVLCIMA